jgi:hypothetical protein
MIYKNRISSYQNFKNYLGNTNLTEIFYDIKTEKYQSEINSIRYAIHKGDTKKADEIKNSLIAFTTSGTFNESRTKENLLSYSQVLGLDFDHIPVSEINQLVHVINNCEYTYASFISPSGEGLKVFIKVDSSSGQHPSAYLQVANFYKALSGYDFDPKCKDITRLCFVSCDPELHLNENATVFKVKNDLDIKCSLSENIKQESNAVDEKLNLCLNYTEKKEQYFNGNRNNFIFLFACNANKFGIFESDTINFCLNNFDLEEREIKATVTNIYKNNIADFAKFAKSAILQNHEIKNKKEEDTTKPTEEDYLKSTPTIPKFVYDNLPPMLCDYCKPFVGNREKDVFLTGALTILSGCLPNVNGIYSGDVVYPNLYSFILAPAASGKGALKHAKELADEYHKKTLQQSTEDRKRYEEELITYNILKKKNKLGTYQEMPVLPKFKVEFIPANTSNAKVIQHLDWNNGKGIICETEADTLGQTLKNDWGGYSDMLRKAFHHEKISFSRKTDNEFVEVNEPRLSVALSGTPKQVFNIITSAEDGLFSRFIFYVFKTQTIWLDPSPKGNPINLTEYFQNKSKEVLEMVEYFETEEMKILLTENQWEKFNDQFSFLLEQTSTFVSNDTQSIIKRFGLISFRLCMIFTAMRKFETKDLSKEIYCSNEDFDTAVALVSVYLEHSLVMYNNLPKQGEQDVFKSGENKKQFFDSLPNEFQRKEAIELAEKYNMKERTTDAFLKTCLGKYLSLKAPGKYEKI